MSLARMRRVGACTNPPGGTCREDPIPVGVYWIDSIDPGAYSDAPTVQVLRETYISLLASAFAGAYRIVRSTHHDAQLIGDTPARDWILFEVTRPIPRWPAGTQWGLPTVAPKGVNTDEGDTAYNTPTPSPIDEAFGGDGIPAWAFVAAGAAGVLAILYALK